MESKPWLDDLTQIRQIMERSTRYLSLSGKAAMLAGVFALVGTGLAYRIIHRPSGPGANYDYDESAPLLPETWQLALLAAAIFVAAAAAGIWFSYQNARRAGQPLWSATARRLMTHFSIPLAAGGVFVLALFFRGEYIWIGPATLLFYGLALLNASHFTFRDMHKLGLLEVALGLMAAWFPGHSLLFWALGFGVLHIVYGFIIYQKYER